MTEKAMILQVLRGLIWTGTSPVLNHEKPKARLVCPVLGETRSNCEETLLDMWPSRRACGHLDCGPNNTLLGMCQRGQRRCQKGKGFFPPTGVSCLARLEVKQYVLCASLW